MSDRIVRKLNDVEDAVKYGLVKSREIINDFRIKYPSTARYFKELITSKAGGRKGKLTFYLSEFFIEDICNNFEAPDFYKLPAPPYGNIELQNQKLSFYPNMVKLYSISLAII